MNKQEWSAVIVLFALLVVWGFFQRGRPGEPGSVPPEPQGVVGVEALPVEPGTVPDPAGPESPPRVVAIAPPKTEPVSSILPVSEPIEIEPTETKPVVARPAERRVVLSNGVAAITVSSWGGVVIAVELQDYRATLDVDDGPVQLDFSARPGLALAGLSGLSTNVAFVLEASNDGRSVRAVRTASDGLTFFRTISLEDDYQMRVVDVLTNGTPATLKLGEYSVGTGPMTVVQSKAKTRGLVYLGLDTLPDQGGEGVVFWGKKFAKLFGHSGSFLSCQRPDVRTMPVAVTHRLRHPTAWVAAKNKFFVQILAPNGGASDCALIAERDMTASNSFVVGTVSASLIFPEKVLDPGEASVREMSYYVGPKSYALLKKLGGHQEEVMQFAGFLRPLCVLLLYTLNAIHGVIGNYGVAIILLTIIVRVLFWPITHKSTESMKKMQQLQPLIKEIRAKHKDKPQKMNQETMALYKEHKVNPMAGCLPLVVQIPVFIALFTVLRSAVELRFAPFLWIPDLSEPEGLFAGLLPIPINILPVFMTVTMIIQQKLTPTTGDPQQQRMMMIMPAVMLFIFYNMASALVLYWSVSQSLSIVQLLLQRRKPTGGVQKSAV